MTIILPVWLHRVLRLPTATLRFWWGHMTGHRMATARPVARMDVEAIHVDAIVLWWAHVVRADPEAEVELDQSARVAYRIAMAANLPHTDHYDQAKARLIEARAIIARYGTGGPAGTPDTTGGGLLSNRRC